MGREVALNSETLTEVPDNRSLKSLSLIVSAHTCIRSKANYPTAGFTERGIAGKDFNLGIIVRRRTLRERRCVCAHQNNHTHERNQLFYCLTHILFSYEKNGLLVCLGTRFKLLFATEN